MEMTKAAERKSSWALLVKLARPYRGMAVAALVLLLCDICGMLFIPTELSALMNAAIEGAGTPELIHHGTAMLLASVIGSGGCVASYWIASRFAANVGRDLRVAVYKKSLDLSGTEFAQIGTGSMITRTLSDANVVQQTLLMSFVMLAPFPVTCVVAIVLAYSTDAVMGQLLLLVTAVILAISALAIKKSAPIFLRLQGFIDRMNARLREAITGTRVIRAFGKEEHAKKRLDETFEDYARNAIRVNFIFAITDATCFCLMNFVEFAIFWLGADRVGAHAMQIGSISALVQYAILILWFSMMAQFALLQMPRAMACMARAQEVLTAVPVIQDPVTPEEFDGTGVQDVASFDHASFRFADASEDTLKDMDFTIPRGAVTAIIGNTGSGKSTIAKLLLRFHDVTEGKAEFLGHDIRNIRQKDLRSRIAYVPQTAWLFSGTIAENLRDGAPEATLDELWHALDIAQASFVRELPEGLAAPVAQGGKNFSGGQRQRLAIARALTRKADLYIFDDSFSALDYKTDAALRHALSQELSDAAVLIIAQRVSTIRDAAKIVVLKDGEISGIGTHDELMESCQDYRDIVESQERGGGADAAR